ncbi:MAG: ATP-binding protein [Thermoplasmata archaeon]|nr:ATP-binding protein [Thermoplasmata archaeon]
MEIARDIYLNRLIERKWNGSVKVITGLRRSGKSYLLFNLFVKHLLSEGEDEGDIVRIDLESLDSTALRHPIRLYDHIRSMTSDGRKRYVLIDEIQKVPEVDNPDIKDGGKITFYDVLNSLLGTGYLDIYVTGSNSRMLSTDILTEFRGRGDEVRVHPLSFSEFYSAVGGDRSEAFGRYQIFGGMPHIVSAPSDEAKMKYLGDLFSETYLKDIQERHRIARLDVMEGTIDVLCSAVGSLTNPSNIAKSVSGELSENTVRTYIQYLIDSFLFSEVKRFDVKGKNYLKYPMKYYCEDVGLRNARLGFRQMESTHLIENIVYNELRMRGFEVDVGVVDVISNGPDGKESVGKEIDFIVNKGNERVYIQSAYAIPDAAKLEQETVSLRHIGDSFRKVVVRMDTIGRWFDDDGILYMNLLDFLLDKDSI